MPELKDKPVATAPETNPSPSGAFALAEQKRPSTKVHAISIPGTIRAGMIVAEIPVAELEKASNGGTNRNTLGVSLTIDFEISGKKFRLHSGFCSLTAR